MTTIQFLICMLVAFLGGILGHIGWNSFCRWNRIRKAEKGRLIRPSDELCASLHARIAELKEKSSYAVGDGFDDLRNDLARRHEERDRFCMYIDSPNGFVPLLFRGKEIRRNDAREVRALLIPNCGLNHDWECAVVDTWTGEHLWRRKGAWTPERGAKDFATQCQFCKKPFKTGDFVKIGAVHSTVNPLNIIFRFHYRCFLQGLDELLSLKIRDVQREFEWRDLE